jgi:hypothetical protein
LISGIARQTRKCSRIPPQTLSRLEDATGRSPLARDRFRIRNQSGRDSKGLLNGCCGGFSKQSLHGGFAENQRNPREIRAKSEGQEKNRGTGTFRKRTAWENAASRFQKRPMLQSKEVKTVANGAKDRACRCGGRGPDGGG